jgi:integrase
VAWAHHRQHPQARIDLVESIAISGRGYLANRTLGTLSKFFNWLIARDVLAVSPVTGVERPHKEKVRDRTLDDAELRALWLACEGEGRFGQALRMLILTGARRNEVSHMRWSEIDEDRRLWILPRERSKNDREHTVPLSSVAWLIIESMPQFADCDYVFTADGRGDPSERQGGDRKDELAAARSAPDRRGRDAAPRHLDPGGREGAQPSERCF